ncbi:hypothetical protein ACQHIV_21035 [Kribbella sp. GL6]|uniref:hypothetical protein n=1 Tax=Kribbella sp. GL6 TaxID=3419765 RepID=UPI003D03F3EC
MAEDDQWKVQLWLGDDYLIEEHIGPQALAEAWVEVLLLRAKTSTGLQARWSLVAEDDPPSRPYWTSAPPT